MAIQDILFLAGAVLLAIALILGACAYHVFRANDIPSVIADLSGRSRQLGIAGQDLESGHASHARRRAFDERRATFARIAQSQRVNGFEANAPTDVIVGSAAAADHGASLDEDPPTELLAGDLDQRTTVFAPSDAREDEGDANGGAAVLAEDFAVTRSELMIGSEIVIVVGKDGE